MVNLLPLSEKIKIQKMYTSRLLIVGLLFLVAVIGVGIVSLSPALFWSFVKEMAALDRLAVVSQIVSAEERKNIQESIADTNQKIALLNSETKTALSISEAVQKVIARKNTEIMLTAFFYGVPPTGDRRVTLTVSGTAANRQALLSFANDIRAEHAFTDVELPVSNFVRNTDIPFSISLSLNNANTNTQ